MTPLIRGSSLAGQPDLPRACAEGYVRPEHARDRGTHGDTPYPSRLLLVSVGGRALYVVVADNADDDETIVVTVYEPDPALWQPGFRRRRRQ